MTAPSSIAATLSRVLELLRNQPESREDQKAAFRDAFASLAGDGALLSAEEAGLTINGSALPYGTPGAREFKEAMLRHGIGELRLPPNLPAGDLLTLLRALAEEQAAETVEAFLRRLPATVTGRIEVRGARALPPASDSRTFDLDALGPGSGSEAGFGVPYREVRLFSPQDPPPEPSVAPAPLTPPLAKVDPVAPRPDTMDRLREIESLADRAMQRKDWEELLTLVMELVRAEETTEGAQRHRYTLTLRRLLPRPALEQMAKFAISGAMKADALTVLQRVGPDATEVLLDLLAAAPTVGERRGYFNLLTQMSASDREIVHKLGHEDWFVVRNVAELCGELRMEAAVPKLVDQIEHPDERVRRAVVGALIKMETTATVEALRKALHDPVPAIRLAVAQGVEGRTAKALTMTLAVQLDTEEHPDVLRELHHALGRIGTSEAVQVLVRAVEPKRKLFGRRSNARRLAAVEGLRLSGAAAAVGALQGLLTDDDDEVCEAARAALAYLKEST